MTTTRLSDRGVDDKARLNEMAETKTVRTELVAVATDSPAARCSKDGKSLARLAQ